jgi:DNA-binding transcriptional ArsR family regulator
MPSNKEVKGNTLKVYLYLIKHSPSDLRDIQHGAGLSSPSLASYHLGKLADAGYVSQNEYGQYLAKNDASEKILEGYSKLGSTVVPQLFFFSLFFTIIVAFFSTEFLYTRQEAYILFLLATCIAMVIVFWYQTAKLWRRLSP